MKERTLGIALNYGNQLVKVLTVLFYTPVLLGTLGQEEYGLYQMVSAVAAYLGLLNLGFSSAYVRFHARCRGREEEARLNGMFLLIFVALAAVSLVCGGCLARNARLVFGSGLSGEELEKAGGILLLLVGNLALTLLGAVFDCQIGARERFCFQHLLRLLQSLLSPFLTLPLLLLGYGSGALAAVSLGLTAVTVASNICYCRNRLSMAVSFRNLQFGLLKELWLFTAFLFLNQVIDQVNWSLDRFLLGRMRGTASVAVYGIGGQINGLFLQLSTAISAVYVPKVHKMTARQVDGETLTDLMIQVGKLQAPVVLLMLSGFLFFGRQFLLLWAGEAYGASYWVALLLMAPMAVPLVQNLGLEIQRARNQHRARTLVYGLLAVGNLVLSICLIPRWGTVGAAAGTAITQILGTTVFMNWYYQKKMGLNMLRFWKELGSCLVPQLPVLLLGAGIGWGSKGTNWKQWLLSAALYTLLSCTAVWKAKKERQAKCLPLREEIRLR